MKRFHPLTEEYQHAYKTTRTDAWWLHNLFTAHIKTLAPAPAFRATARLGKFFASKF